MRFDRTASAGAPYEAAQRLSHRQGMVTNGAHHQSLGAETAVRHPRVELEGLVLNRRHIGKALGCGASAWDHAYASAMTREGGWRCTMDGQVGYNHNLALLFPRVLKRYYQGQSVCPSLQGEQTYL